MKELFRERDYTRVGYYQSLLEAEGIETFVRNETVSNMVLEVPIPDMYPALCVVNDQDYHSALGILKEARPAMDSEVPDEPVKAVFLSGVIVIFGGGALCVIAMLMGQLTHEQPLVYPMFVLRLAIVLGCLWIVRTNAKRWFAQKRMRTVSAGG